MVGPPTGAVPARPVPPDRLVAAAAPSERTFPLLPLLGLLLLAALALGALVLLARATASLFSAGNQLPGAPGLPVWALLAVVVVAAVTVTAARAAGRRGAGGFNWRRLRDTRVAGIAIAALLLVAAYFTSAQSPGYSADIRELPGEVGGLLQQAVARPEPGYPRIRIKRVGIDLLLVKGDGKTPPVKYEAFTYPHADHLLDQQGTTGNTYVYAHARTGMFWNLHDLNIGDEVDVDFGGGKVFRYRVSEIHKQVNWKDFSWLQPTSDDRLTLQTCNGWKDDDPRFIVVAHRFADSSTALAR